MNLLDLLPWLRAKPKRDPVSVVLRHFGVPDADHDDHLLTDSAGVYTTLLSGRARNTYRAIYRSLSLEERQAAERRRA